MYKIISKGVCIIGHYQPKPQQLIADHIGLDILELTQRFSNTRIGACPSQWFNNALAAEVRAPEYYDFKYENGILKAPNYGIAAWHKDDPPCTLDLSLILWSNKEQTEIQLVDQNIFIADGGDILLVRNDLIKHRTPRRISPDRWFFRRIVDTPEWFKNL